MRRKHNIKACRRKSQPRTAFDNYWLEKMVALVLAEIVPGLVAEGMTKFGEEFQRAIKRSTLAFDASMRRN